MNTETTIERLTRAELFLERLFGYDPVTGQGHPRVEEHAEDGRFIPPTVITEAPEPETAT